MKYFQNTARLPPVPKYNLFILVQQKIKTVFNMWLQASHLHGDRVYYNIKQDGLRSCYMLSLILA